MHITKLARVICHIIAACFRTLITLPEFQCFAVAMLRFTLSVPNTIRVDANAGSSSPHKCLKTSIELLTSIMRAPMESNVCVWIINNAIDCITEGLKMDRRELEAQTKFASQQSDLLRAAVHFLTRCRTLPEHQEMIAHFSACRCNMDLKRVRDRHRCCARKLSHFGIPAKADIMSGLPKVPPGAVIAQMAELMVDMMNFALLKMTPNRFHSQKWPRSAEDLLPFGVEHTIDAIRNWGIESPPLERNMAYRMCYLFSLVYDTFGHELCRPSEDGSFKHDLPFVLAILHFDELLDEFDTELKALADAGMVLPPPVDEKIAPAYEEIVSRVDTFCIAVLRTWYMIEHAKGRMVVCRGDLSLVLATNDGRFKPIFDRLSSVCARANPSSEIGHVPIEIALLEESGPRGERTRPDNSEGNSGTVNNFFNKSYREKLTMAWVRLLGVRTWGCLYPDCPLPIADGMRTRLCAKCVLIPYCSIECQKKAWKDPRLSHKDMCSLILSIRDRLGQDIWDKILSGREITTITQFEHVCREKDVNEDLLLMLGYQLGILQIVKAKRRTGNLWS